MSRSFAAFVILTVAAGATLPVHAQSGGNSYGALAGISISKGGGADIGGENKVVTGTAAGVFFTLGVSRLLALEPQLLMVEKGVKSEEAGLSATIKLTYFELPLLAKLRFPRGPEGRVIWSLFAGPGVAFRIGCRFKLAQVDTGNELAGGCDSDGEAEDIRSFDSSLIVGLGVDVGRTTVSLRYDHGLTRLDGSVEANDIKNRALILLAGVKVGMNR